jgi:hypothetical protein
MLHKQYLLSAGAGALLVASVGAGALTYAQTTTNAPTHTSQTRRTPGVGGVVSAVSGNTITVTSKDKTTYTIEAGSATITKETTVGVADVKVGDTVMADGTVTGTTVAATTIHDGIPPRGMGGMGGFGHGKGQGIRAVVSAISGNTLTVSSSNTQDNTSATYTVDASSAKVFKAGMDGKPSNAVVADVSVGDSVMVQGEVNGSVIMANLIFDGRMPQWIQKPKASTTTSTTQ